MKTPCAAFVFFVALSVTATPWAQVVFRGGVETVEVTVTVTDASGRLITGLAKDDFSVFEDGMPQPITHFTDERVPVSLGILLDVSDGMRGRPIADARSALDQFVGERLEQGDEAFVAIFNHEAWAVTAWTQPPGQLRGTLADIKPSGSTAIYDAITTITPVFERRAHRRTALVLISDGADTASDATLTRARDVLRRADPFVYAVAVDSSSLKAVSTRVNPDALRDLTGPSGGYTEVIHSSEELGPATERIAYELNHQYTLAYSPTRAGDGQWRAIRVRLRNPGHLARARRGYFSVLRPAQP